MSDNIYIVYYCETTSIGRLIRGSKGHDFFYCGRVINKRRNSINFSISCDRNKTLSLTTKHKRARPTIESLDIVSDISNKFAVTTIKSNIRNDHPESREAVFDALIPPNALITGLKLFVGGEGS